MFKKKIKKGTIVGEEDFKQQPSDDNNAEQDDEVLKKVDKISQESKSIKKKPIRGVEVIEKIAKIIFQALPKTLDFNQNNEDNSKELTGLLDKEILKKGGTLEFLEKNKKKTNDMATSDAYGGKFTRKSEIEKPDILKSLGSEIAQVLKTVDKTVEQKKDQSSWVPGLMEVNVSLDKKIQNIEANEAAKFGGFGEWDPNMTKERRREMAKLEEEELEYRKAMDSFEKMHRKEGRKYAKEKFIRKLENSIHESTNLH